LEHPIIGDILKPKSFAGLFGAAPSVALATLAMTVVFDGSSYAAIEGRSMMAGAIAFFVYASLVSRIMMLQVPGHLGHLVLSSCLARCGGGYLLLRLGWIVMRIKVDLSTLGQTKWHDYAVRFLFGGLITTVAGIIVKKFGPGIGGLFLAFPAIFPASATLIEKHEKEKKESLGLKGAARGRSAASIDAAGSSMGSIGLVVFALVVSHFMSRDRAWIVLGGVTVLWLGVSVAVWQIRKAL
jgi:hypothetical protein